MIRWCAFCQHLIGESEPYDDFQITHGACESCMALYEADPKAGPPANMRARDVFHALSAAARRSDLGECEERVRAALEAGLQPTEIAVGVLQPALYEVGRKWASGQVTMAEEHRFTAWCEKAFALLPMGHAGGGRRPKVLLACVEGNRHDVGVRFAMLYLRALGQEATAIYPGVPDGDLLALIEAEKPDAVALSVSLADQMPTADRTSALLLNLPTGLKVFVGGLAVRAGARPADPRVGVCRTLQDLAAGLGVGARTLPAPGGINKAGNPPA